jgi:hypothetical protein
MKIIQIIGLADGRVTKHDQQYLVSFDFEQDAMHGLTASRMPSEARKFDSLADALEYWKTRSVGHPTRHTDGKPNRPFTGWTITVLEYTDLEYEDETSVNK